MKKFTKMPYKFIKKDFDYIGEFYNNFAIVIKNNYFKKNKKYNWVNTKLEIQSSIWFDFIDNFINGFAIIKKNEKFNWVNLKLKIQSKEWFDDIEYMKNYKYKVKINDNLYEIDLNEKISIFNSPYIKKIINNIRKKYS